MHSSAKMTTVGNRGIESIFNLIIYADFEKRIRMNSFDITPSLKCESLGQNHIIHRLFSILIIYVTQFNEANFY